MEVDFCSQKTKNQSSFKTFMKSDPLRCFNETLAYLNIEQACLFDHNEGKFQ